MHHTRGVKLVISMELLKEFLYEKMGLDPDKSVISSVYSHPYHLAAEFVLLGSDEMFPAVPEGCEVLPKNPIIEKDTAGNPRVVGWY